MACLRSHFDDWHAFCMSPVVMIDKVSAGLEQYMDLVSLRQRLVSANIANAETPNYRTKDVDFATEMQGLLDGHAPQTVEPEGLKVKSDGNNVNLDREMRLLSENALRFQIASSLVKTELRQVRLAIQEGKNG